MHPAFVLIMALFILQRITELRVSARNETWLLAQGAVQYGQRHYPFMMFLHTAFICSILIEYLLNPGSQADYLFVTIWILLILAKVYVIRNLGHYWNTRIYRIPGAAPVRTGIYRCLRHPNYILVAAEILTFPLIFHLYYTAVIFTLLNALMLRVRIGVENRVWSDAQQT